jgi:acetyltransferase-like isoleucine patch superfamily enzyme
MIKKFISIIKMVLLFPVLIFSKKSPLSIYRNCNFDKTVAVLSGSRIYKSVIKKYSYVGRKCLIINTEIGAFCSISDDCFIGLGSHPIDWVSTSPVFLKGKNILKRNFSSFDFDNQKKTKIENDVWIGAGVKIIQSITIGNGAIIGAGAVVSKDIPPYAIAVGTPIKIIKYRFEPEIIEKLQKIEWWNKDEKVLKSVEKYFFEVNKFIELLGN